MKNGMEGIVTAAFVGDVIISRVKRCRGEKTPELLFLSAMNEEVWSAFTRAAVENTLPAHERQQSLKFRNPLDGQARLLGRLLMKLAIKEMCGKDNIETLAIGPQGRPFFPWMKGDINISHCDGLVVCVVSPDAKVGIDVERVGNVPVEAITAFLNPAEWHFLDEPAKNLPDVLMKLWVAKEAVVKASGCGLTSQRMPVFEVLPPTEIVYAEEVFQVRDVDVFPSFRGAVAWRDELN